MRVLYIVVGLMVMASPTPGQEIELVRSAAANERAPYLETLRELVSIDSGSRDIEGLNRIAAVIATRLRTLGGDVEVRSPSADVTRFEDTPEQIGPTVEARFRGTGSVNILLLAHMDTVYERGMGAAQPFRIDGNRAYGLGIADDKHGVALILHTVAMLNTLDFRDYGTLTVLINGDEEISSPGSRSRIEQLGREHDVIFSCEGSGSEDRVRLATSGNGDVLLRVTGRASHAGSAPEQGRNALYELAHQIMQMRDLSDLDVGLKMNWTVARAGTVRNIIPPYAEAMADVRVLRTSDWDVIEAQVRSRVVTTMVPDTHVEVIVERRRPALTPTTASRALAAHATQVYAEIDRELGVVTEGTGGGTDAAIAALSTQAPVMEGLGPQGFGAHSDSAEYINIDSVGPRLYLLSRMIMDVATARVAGIGN